MNLKVMLLVVVSALTLARAPLRAQADDAARARGTEPAAESAKWERYTYGDEEFSVELPESPFVFHTSRHVNRTLSDSEKMRVFGVYSGGVVFMIASYDKPRDGETFDDFAGYTGDGGPGSLVSRGNVTLKGLAGKEYARPDGLAWARVFRAKKRAYLLKAYARAADDPKVTRFLNSLTLEAETSGVKIAESKAEAARVTRSAPAAGTGPNVGGGGSIAAGTGAGEGSGGGIGPSRGKNPADGRVEGGVGPGTGPPLDYNRPFRPNEVTRKASVVYKPEPGYTEEARRNNVAGVVRLRAVLSSRGKVTNISVVKGLPDGLTEKAIHAARHLLFLPAMKDGREVSQFVVIEYNFNIY